MVPGTDAVQDANEVRHDFVTRSGFTTNQFFRLLGEGLTLLTIIHPSTQNTEDTNKAY